MNFIILTKNQGAILGPIAEIFGWIMDFLFKITSQVGILNIRSEERRVGKECR